MAAQPATAAQPPQPAAKPEPAAKTEPVKISAQPSAPALSLGRGVTMKINSLAHVRYTWADGAHGNNVTSAMAVKTARLKFSGDLPEGFKYGFQFAFDRKPSTDTINAALYDRAVMYAPTPAFGLTAGQFTAPSGGEALQGLDKLDFNSRYYAMDRMLNPPCNHDTGLMASGGMRSGRWRYWAGLFNGDGANRDTNADRKFMYAGRLVWTPWKKKGAFRDEEFTAAASVTAERTLSDASAMKASDLKSPTVAFTAPYDRRVYEADLLWRSGRLALSGEYMTARLGGRGGDRDVKAEGWHLTAARMLGGKWELLLRRQGYDPDSAHRNKYDIAWTTLGANWFINGQYARLIFNYTIKEERRLRSDNNEAALQLQLAF